MEPQFKRNNAASSISRVSNMAYIPEYQSVSPKYTMLTRSESINTSPDNCNNLSSPTHKKEAFGSKLKRQISAVTDAVPKYFSVRPALSMKSLTTFQSVDETRARLSECDMDLEQDWISDDDESNTQTDNMFDETSALQIYKQESMESNTSNYNTFTFLSMGGDSVVGYKNFWRQQTIEDSLNKLHAKKKRRIKRMTTAEDETIKLQPTISIIPLKTIRPTMNKYGAIFAIINVYVNNTMLFNPYAFMKGGLISIVIYALICLWLCHCAKLIIKMFKQVPAPMRTFPGVSKLGYGMIGSVFVCISIILENIGRTTIGIITMWANILFLLQYEIFNAHKVATVNWNTVDGWITISSCLFLLPLVFYFINLSDMFIGGILVFFSTALLSILILSNFISMGFIGVTQINFVPKNIEDLVLCIGIFISNLAGHACLPSVYSQMTNPEEFDSVINISWIIIFFIQVLTGISGYLTFGNDISFIITHAMIASGANHILTIILIVLLILSAYFHTPIGIVVALELPQSLLQIKHSLIKRIFHAICFFIIVSIAWLLVSHIATLSAVIGSILTLTISMLCPLCFKLHLDKNKLSWWKLWILKCFIFSTVIFGGLMLYVDTAFRRSQQRHKSKW
eukprot:388291_1